MSSTNEVKEFYTNDVVYRFDKRKRIIFGIVIDSYESFDSDESHALQKGQIKVFWLNTFSEQVWRQSRVKLLSRTILPGDIVRRLEQGKETQRGYCRSVQVSASVQIVGTDKVIENVSQERLMNIVEYDYNIPVCWQNKVGRIQNFEQKITLMSKCGSVVQLLTSINDSIEDIWLSERNKTTILTEFYNGQEVSAVPSSFEQPVWQVKSKNMRRSMHNRHRFVVYNVEITDVEIEWLIDGDKEVSTVENFDNSNLPQLKLLLSAEENSLELIERRLLKISSSDKMIKKRDWLVMQSALCRPEIRKVLRKNRDSKTKLVRGSSKTVLTNGLAESEKTDDDGEWSTDEEYVSDNDSVSSGSSSLKKVFQAKTKDYRPGRTVPVEILCLDSKATIVWQDGTEEKDVPTTQLYFSISLDDHEFFPGEWVASNDKSEKYGVIQKVDYLERTATIKWFTYCNVEKKQTAVCTNEMSVYDIIKHPHFPYRPGATVCSKLLEKDRLGTVLDTCPEGYIIVKWISGQEEQCWPQDIDIAPEIIEFVGSSDEENDMSADVSWETESIESIPGEITISEPLLQNIAARLDFLRSRIMYLKEAFKQHIITENFGYLRDLLTVYDNSSYLDKLLDTSFFSLKSKHYQAILQLVREKAKAQGAEVRGRLLSVDNTSSNKLKSAERENISKVLKLEQKINALIGNKDNKESGEPSVPQTPETDNPSVPADSLCLEILSMIKLRMDLAYAEIISRIGGAQVGSVITKALEPATPTSSTPLYSFPTTPDTSLTSVTLTPPKLTLEKTKLIFDNQTYCVIDEAPTTHRFHNMFISPTDKQRFFKAVQNENTLLQESLPPGVWVRSYANRLDLLSVMIRGPDKTPYEDGLFLFDIQLSADYPRSPPLVSYISYSSERLNPNLYVEGRVCISLLGTWLGRGTEVWGTNSTLLQLIVSIQGLILVAEPYYNEAGYEKHNKSQQGYENSRTYNELVLLKLVQSMTELLLSPPEVFKEEVFYHFSSCGDNMCKRLKGLINDPEPNEPEFPLLPVSKGLKLSLNAALDKFHYVVNREKSCKI